MLSQLSLFIRAWSKPTGGSVSKNYIFDSLTDVGN